MLKFMQTILAGTNDMCNTLNDKDFSLFLTYTRRKSPQTKVGKKTGNSHISQDGGKYW